MLLHFPTGRLMGQYLFYSSWWRKCSARPLETVDHSRTD
jgi:hypothetical protein